MSSIIKCGPSPSKLAFWVDWKMADIISPFPGGSKPRSKRRSGKSISVEEQQIILNVAKYFQEESKSGNKPQFRAEAVIAKTAAVTGVSKNSVRKIVYVGKVIDEGKTRKAKVRVGKLDNFDVGVIRRIIHNLYRENISPRKCLELTDTLLVSTLKLYSLHLKIQMCKAGSFHRPKIWLSRLQIIHKLILSYWLEPLLLFIKEKSLNGSQQKRLH